jgi:hypothetical protein
MKYRFALANHSPSSSAFWKPLQRQKNGGQKNNKWAFIFLPPIFFAFSRGEGDNRFSCLSDFERYPIRARVNLEVINVCCRAVGEDNPQRYHLDLLFDFVS